MELVARVLITIPDDKWQESLAEEIEARKEELEKRRNKYGVLTFSSIEKRIPETALQDMKYDIGKALEDTLHGYFKTWYVNKVEFI